MAQSSKTMPLWVLVVAAGLSWGISSSNPVWGQDGGPIAYWTMDDDSGEDETGDYPLTYIGNYEIVDGVMGNAVRFVEGGADLADGSAVRPNDDEPLDLLDDFTLQAWVNWNSLDGEQVIMEKFTGAGGPGWTLTKLGDNSILFFAGADINRTSICWNWINIARIEG